MTNSKNPEYSIVIPAHNEEGNILPFVARIVKMATANRLSYEVIAIDDVSSDNTGKLLDKLSDKFPQIRVIHRFSKNGPGNAERAGFAVARGKWIITLDSDLSHRPEEIPDFIAAANKGFDMVIGSRFVSGGSMDGPAFRLLLSQSCAFAAKLITGYPLHDASSGYRIMRASALRKLNLQSGWFEIHTEIPVKFHLHGYKVGEIPIRYERRGEGQSKLTIFQSVPKYLGIMITERMKKLASHPEYKNDKRTNKP
ncbi:glycosyltransferase [Candidatus Collierbacteria bacterium]|nr:glycosyltransferase [Candidatus Collierbacteria bacterium]